MSLVVLGSLIHRSRLTELGRTGTDVESGTVHAKKDHGLDADF